jgi:hypothetical protein
LKKSSQPRARATRRKRAKRARATPPTGVPLLEADADADVPVGLEVHGDLAAAPRLALDASSGAVALFMAEIEKFTGDEGEAAFVLLNNKVTACNIASVWDAYRARMMLLTDGARQ